MYIPQAHAVFMIILQLQLLEVNCLGGQIQTERGCLAGKTESVLTEAVWLVRQSVLTEAVWLVRQSVLTEAVWLIRQRVYLERLSGW